MRKILAAVLLVAVTACTSTPRETAQASTSTDIARVYEIGNVRLYTETLGKGPPILFLHGGLHFFDNSFANQKEYFAAFRTVIGVDQRGHGHSPDNEQPFSYREMADNTAALIEKLGVAPVDVVGWSDGGNVGLLLARYYPQLVRRLVVSGANIRGDADGAAAYDEFKKMPVERLAATLPPQWRADYARVSPDGEEHWLIAVAKSKELWLTPVVLEQKDLGAIQAPVLVVAGDHDVFPLEHTIEIYRGLPKGQLCVLPATRHATMIQRPEDFNRLAREFLEQNPAR
jgi:pimeloyl-ACP methyl ester carboxylesterase